MTTLLSSAPFYAGSALTLRCDIEISEAVDIPYTVAVTWLKSGSQIIGSDERTTISNVTQLSPYTYEASIGLNPLSITFDTGSYTCQVVVSPGSSVSLVQRASQTDMLTLTVQGKLAV